MATTIKYRRPSHRCPHCAWPITRGQNPFAMAIDQALDNDPTTDANGLALIAALRAFDERRALRLLAKPCNVNVLDDRGVSPLMVAAYRGYAEICQRLLNLGADARHFVEKILYEYNEDSNADEEVEEASTHAKMGGDKETIALILRAEVRARWADIQFLRDEEGSFFNHVGTGLLAEAANLDMVAICVEMHEAGLSVDPNDSNVKEALFDAVENRNIRTSLILSALGADLGDLGSEGLFSYDFVQALEKEKARIQEEWNAEDEAKRLRIERTRAAREQEIAQSSIDRPQYLRPTTADGWMNVNPFLTIEEAQGLVENPPRPAPSGWSSLDYVFCESGGDCYEPAEVRLTATKVAAVSATWVSACYSEAVVIAKRLAAKHCEDIDLRRLPDGWGISKCPKSLAEPGEVPETEDSSEPTAIGLAPPDWEDGSPDEVDVERYGSYSHSWDVD